MHSTCNFIVAIFSGLFSLNLCNKQLIIGISKDQELIEFMDILKFYVRWFNRGNPLHIFRMTAS